MPTRGGRGGGFGLFWINASVNDSEPPSRREIRSWVTSVQHARKRDDWTGGEREKSSQVFVRAEAIIPSPSPSNSSSSTSSSTAPTAQYCRKRKAISADSPLPRLSLQTDEDSLTARPSKHIKRIASKDSTPPARNTSAAARATALAASVLGIDPSTILLSNCLEDPTDPLRLYASSLRVPAATLWTHYLWQEREHGRLFKAQYGQFGNIAPKFLHPRILGNPAMLSTTVLFTACHLRYMQAPATVMTSELLQIRSLAYSHVQAAINSEERLDDSTFLAIIKLALWEVVFGSLSAFTVHMQGISRMVHLRGGLGNVGPGGYVGCILRWFDANFTAVSGIPSFLEHEASVAGIQYVETDPEAFLLGVKTLEFSSDSEGQFSGS